MRSSHNAGAAAPRAIVLVLLAIGIALGTYWYLTRQPAPAMERR